MASSRSLISPWGVFKRLQFHTPHRTLLAPRARLYASNTDTTPEEKALVKTEGTTALAQKPEENELALEEAEEDEDPYDDGDYRTPLHEKLLDTDDAPGAISISPQMAIRASLIELANERNIPLPPILQPDSETLDAPPRLPRSVQALYLTPLRRQPTHGIPVANLQLRSFSVRNLEFMADFALRAAYYLNLPARGPVPLPRITQRWTVPRDVFIFKKSQENFERVTLRRLIQVQDGHPDVVRRWLGFVRRHCWYGVGMKADVFEWEDEKVVERMDQSGEVERIALEKVDWELFGRRKGLDGVEEVGKGLMGRGFAGGEGAKGEKMPVTPSVQG